VSLGRAVPLVSPVRRVSLVLTGLLVLPVRKV
jgi:hypothetical protein